MKRLLSFVLTLAVAGMIGVTAGCKKKEEPPKTETAPTPTAPAKPEATAAANQTTTAPAESAPAEKPAGAPAEKK